MYQQPDKTDPVDALAHYLSEWHNDNAPIGWERYRPVARDMIKKFNIAEAVKRELCK